MQSIKVVMVGLPNMLRDILLGVFANAPDIKIVGNYHDFVELLSTQAAPGADVIVLGGQDEQLDTMSLDFLERHPRSTVIGVAAHGHNTFLVQLSPKLKTLGEVSPEEMLTAIRDAMLGEAWSMAQ